MSELPNGWRRVKLGELGEVVRGVSFDKSEVSEAPRSDSDIAVLRATNITGNGLNVCSDLIFVKAERVAPRQMLQLNDVVIAMSSGSKSVVGKAVPMQREWRGSFGAFCGVFRTDASKAEPEIVANAFRLDEYRRHVEREAMGTNINNLTPRHITSFEIPLPPLPEQRAIASTLRAVQNAKDARRREVELERERKAALMSHLFSNGTRGEVLHDTPLGKLPQSWRVEKLGKVANCQGGSGFPPALQGKTEGRYPFLKVSDMNLPENKTRITTANNYISEEVRASLKATAFEAETIIFPKVGAAIHTNKKRVLSKPSIVDNNVMAVWVIDNERCAPEFLFHFFVKISLSTFVNDGPLPSINGSTIKGAHLPLPPLQEQREIAAILKACDDKLTALNEEIARLEELFRALLEELMSGRLSTAALT